MEHKEKPLLLFFVMDNGPLAPEQLRQVIFEPGFACNPASSQRTGGRHRLPTSCPQLDR